MKKNEIIKNAIDGEIKDLARGLYGEMFGFEDPSELIEISDVIMNIQVEDEAVIFSFENWKSVVSLEDFEATLVTNEAGLVIEEDDIESMKSAMQFTKKITKAAFDVAENRKILDQFIKHIENEGLKVENDGYHEIRIIFPESAEAFYPLQIIQLKKQGKLNDVKAGMPEIVADWWEKAKVK
jgi:hypothetical protein